MSNADLWWREADRRMWRLKDAAVALRREARALRGSGQTEAALLTIAATAASAAIEAAEAGLRAISLAQSGIKAWADARKHLEECEAVLGRARESLQSALHDEARTAADAPPAPPPTRVPAAQPLRPPPVSAAAAAAKAAVAAAKEAIARAESAVKLAEDEERAAERVVKSTEARWLAAQSLRSAVTSAFTAVVAAEPVASLKAVAGTLQGSARALNDLDTLRVSMSALLPAAARSEVIREWFPVDPEMAPIRNSGVVPPKMTPAPPADEAEETPPEDQTFEALLKKLIAHHSQ